MISAELLLEARDLGCTLQGTEILSGIELQLKPGEVVGLIGPNGAGKSTLLKCLMGYYPLEGRVLVRGEELDRMSGARRAEQISYVSQQGPDQLSFTTLEVVEMGAYGQIGLFGRSRYDDREQALRSLEYVGMRAFASRSFATLSGGERQLVLFARLLLQDAPILLLDEPTSNLDIGHEQTVLDMVDELRSEGKSSIIAIHNLNLAAEYCDRLILLDGGRVTASGSPEEVLTAGNLESAYRTRLSIGRNQDSGSLAVTPLRAFKAAGGARVHIIGGAGSGVNLTRSLLRAGYRVSGGIAHRLDSDARLWEALGIDAVFVDAFDEIDDGSFALAGELIARADWTVLTAFPLGRGNLRNIELADGAKRLIILEDHPRSFYAAGARDRFDALKPAYWAGSAAEVLDIIGAG
jgi:iron complex transport system ATP-binding protein